AHTERHLFFHVCLRPLSFKKLDFSSALDHPQYAGSCVPLTPVILAALVLQARKDGPKGLREYSNSQSYPNLLRCRDRTTVLGLKYIRPAQNGRLSRYGKPYPEPAKIWRHTSCKRGLCQGWPPCNTVRRALNRAARTRHAARRPVF